MAFSVKEFADECRRVYAKIWTIFKDIFQKLQALQKRLQVVEKTIAKFWAILRDISEQFQVLQKAHQELERKTVDQINEMKASTRSKDRLPRHLTSRTELEKIRDSSSHPEVSAPHRVLRSGKSY
jgi:chromosome segregation ATPase